MEKLTRLRMDTSKRVLQLHGVDDAQQPVLRKKLTRERMVAFFQALPLTVVAHGQRCSLASAAALLADFNLIENAFSKLKALLRKLQLAPSQTSGPPSPMPSHGSRLPNAPTTSPPAAMSQNERDLL